MNNTRISALLLERYHIGEVTCEEKKLMEEALENNGKLAEDLADLDRADSDFFTRFPAEKIIPADNLRTANFKRFSRRPVKIRYLAIGFSAAALLIIVFINLYPFNNSGKLKLSERIKGKGNVSGSSINSFIKLSIYLKENITGDIVKLTDQCLINEGNTIQLVYSVPENSSKDKYGVIFSIDGRAVVTMHYPHSSWQSTLLDRGRAVPLDEAFTLDDAPNYEIFFFIAADSPIDVESIITTAEQLAVLINENPNETLTLGAAAFNDYEVETFTLLKE